MAAAELRDDDCGDVAGPSTHLDNSEEVCSNVSEFAQVVFNNVQECYPPASDLQCNYTLTPAIKPHARDWIGIFKVGWTSTRQYRAFEWAPCPSKWTEGQDWTQDITFKAYYLPKDEDGEYYQLCYIDSAGKMRGASTPFQFLEQSADDFVQIIDDSMDILMIHNKTEYCVEELKRVQGEKQEIEVEFNALREKVVVLEKELGEAREHLDKITKEYETRTTSSLEMEEELRNTGEQLEEARTRVSQLAEEAGNYERSLQQTEGAFMEVVNRELALRNKLDDLERKYGQMCSERDTLKARVESAEHNNAEMCEEIDNLKELLSHSNQTHQEVRESEVRMKEQYQRMQHDIQQNFSDKEQYQMMEAKFASTESSRTLLNKELDSLKMVQEKLSRDLVIAKTEKESLKVAMHRQTKEIKEERKKMQLVSHQNRERTALLQEQIGALKDGIQQLAQEKEMVSKGTKGSIEAQQIATKDLKDKMRRAQHLCREEVRRRGDMQKKMVSMENSFKEEKNELMREVEDLRVRLQMAAEEYKRVYTDCRQLQAKLEKKKVSSSSAASVMTASTSTCSSTGSNNSDLSTSSPEKDRMKEFSFKDEEVNITSEEACGTSPALTVATNFCQGIQVSATQCSQATQSVAAVNNVATATKTRSRDDTFDLREMHDQMCELSRALDDRKKETDRYRRLHQDEKEKAAQLERVWRLKFESLEGKHGELQDKYNKTLNEYTRMKHGYESLKFDMDTQRQSPNTTPVGTPTERSPAKFRNPYAQPPNSASQPSSNASQTSGSIEAASRYGNPYTSPSDDPNGERLPEGLMEVSVDSLNLDSIRYPPETTEDAALSDASDAIPPALLLPEPMQPHVLPEGKIAAIKLMSSQLKEAVEHTDDESEGAQFVDAQEFPEDSATPVASAPPLTVAMPPETMPPTTPTATTRWQREREERERERERDLPPSPWGDKAKKCPECVIEFPPMYPEEDFVKHVQRHFAKLCPVCQGLLDPRISQMDFQKHVEDCLTRNQ